MSSINTNLSAMTALQALKATQTAMNKNQNQISTGLRVSEASHNASYWSIATAMKSDNGALSAVKDSIGQSKAMINTFTSAMDKSLTYLNKMKAGLVAATQPGADLAKIQTEFKANIEGMKSAAGSASFNGQNWLAGSSGDVNLVTSYDGTTNTVGTLAIDTSKTNLFDDASKGTGGLLGSAAAVSLTPATQATETGGTGGAAGVATLAAADLKLTEGTKLSITYDGGAAKEYIVKKDDDLDKVIAGITALGITGVTASKNSGDLVLTGQVDKVVSMTQTTKADSDAIAAALKTIDEAIASVTEGSAMLGANKALLETQEEFISVLSDSLTAGVSSFVDADMNEASTRNQALQTQQQLGVQALSMANQNSSMILKLFQ
ncbi:flagellin [Microvirga sp. TS319]|uniref:flagellin N-terminal helical domain-containing protein n=1 Tax=Microvirga sp. TS319 TaxID=3241165 RepID=UPI00351A8EA2